MGWVGTGRWARAPPTPKEEEDSVQEVTSTYLLESLVVDKTRSILGNLQLPLLDLLAKLPSDGSGGE